MTQEIEKIVATLEKGEATPEQQKEAARVIRDLSQEVQELSAWEQGD
jgi:hypothetical protein